MFKDNLIQVVRILATWLAGYLVYKGYLAEGDALAFETMIIGVIASLTQMVAEIQAYRNKRKARNGTIQKRS